MNNVRGNQIEQNDTFDQLIAYNLENAKNEQNIEELRNQIVADFINNNPNAVLEIPFTEKQMEEAEKKEGNQN